MVERDSGMPPLIHQNSLIANQFGFQVGAIDSKPDRFKKMKTFFQEVEAAAIAESQLQQSLNTEGIM